MEIIYPPLVEESVRYHLKGRNRISDKAAMYRTMVEKGIISDNGQPTTYALEQGLVKEFYEEADLSLADFLAIYPVFQQYDLELFQKIDGFWEIPLKLKATLLQDLSTGEFDYDEAIQLKEYLADR